MENKEEKDIPIIEIKNRETNESDNQQLIDNQKSNKEQPSDKKTKNKKSKRKKIIITILIVIVALFLLVLLVGFLIFHHFYGKLNIDHGNIHYITTEYVEEDADPNATDSSLEDISAADEALKNNATPVMFSNNVYNILLIGNDTRDKNVLGRSDSMIILSINKKSKEIIMTSVMRDSYVAIPGHGNNRINTAYAIGGPELLIDTIEQNFKIKIDSYVGVNFFTFKDTIDILGGVKIKVDDAEADIINGENKPALPGGGTYNLNGGQALTYARIRHYGNADYQRTERQRIVLNQVIEQTKDCSLSELNELLNQMLPEITTDIEEGELISLLINYTTEYKDYDVVSCRVPCDGSIDNLVINGAMVLGVDLPANVDYIKDNVYHE